MGIYDDKVEGYGSKWLARNVDGIDIIVDGHSHTYLSRPIKINKTYIVQAADWGRYMGQGIINFENGKISSFFWLPIPINLMTSVKNADGSTSNVYINYKNEPDPNFFFQNDQNLMNILMPYKEKVKDILAEKIGEALGDFPNDNVRKMETELGNLVADSMLWYTKNTWC